MAPHPLAWPRPKTPCQRSRQASGYPPADRAMPRKGKSVNANPRERGRLLPNDSPDVARPRLRIKTCRCRGGP